jgi:DNA-binding CsgD family transcriptional regulator
MTRLRDQDLKDVLLVTRAALECDRIDEMREEVLYHMERIFQCDKSTFFLTRKPYKNVDFAGVVYRGFENKFMDEFIQYYHQLDPHVPGLRYNPSIVTTEQLISFKDLVVGEYYNDFLKPQSIHYQMDMILRSGKRLLGVLAFLRPQNAKNFSSRERTKAELIVQNLVEILGKNILLDQIREHSAIFESIAMDIPYKSKMFLNESLEPIYMDENAKKIISCLFRREEGQRESQFFLPEEICQRCEELKKIASLEEHLGPHQQRFSLDISGSGQQLSILVRLIEKQNRTPVFLICLESEDPVLALNDRLRRSGLTPREREVVYHVCQGLKNIEISEKLYISKYTVENHLKSIYGKMRIHTRTALVHRLIHLT